MYEFRSASNDISFKHIFYDWLPKGSFTAEVLLLPRYDGTYILNPAKVEMMYFPVFYGRNEIKKVEISNTLLY